MIEISKDLYNEILKPETHKFTVNEVKYVKVSSELYTFDGYLSSWENHIFIIMNEDGALFSLNLKSDQYDVGYSMQYWMETKYFGDVAELYLKDYPQEFGKFPEEF